MEAKKSLGQHFLHDVGIILRIMQEIKGAKNIIEIGGGKGALTEYLVKLNIPITVVEIDNNLSVYLKDKFKKHNVQIVNCDATSFTLQKKATIVGNLPYNASKRIIKNMISQKEKIDKMIFMVQKEVASSIVAKPTTKEYTKFSVFIQLFCKTKRLFNVKKNSFIPPPKVESSVVELIPYKKNRLNKNIDKNFFKFLNILFAHPRKTVKNNIKQFIKNIDYIEQSIGDVLNKRPKELSIDKIYQVYLEYYHE